jgi:hypothetical protein
VQRLSAAFRVALLLVPVAAHADHHRMAMEPADASSASYSAGVSLLAATFSPSQAENMYFGGNYEGLLASGTWSYDRYSAGASGAYYRLLRNGAEAYGYGDLVLEGQVAIVERRPVQTGAIVAVSVPIGDSSQGLGMGHTMLMPAGYVAGRNGRLAFAGSFGYSRALASSGHVHGMEPLVEPMNMSELTWSGGGDVAIAAGVRGGGRLSGGLPIAATLGTDRVIGALHVAWGSGSVDTVLEMQIGLVGDPFNIRGVFSTALKF